MTRLKNIAIDAHALCAPELDQVGADPQQKRWLAEAAIQRSLYALDAELKPFETSMIGITFDHVNRTAIVVFHTTFNGFEAVRERLLDKLAPLQVTLRPGCHSPEQIAEARSLLEARDWHPRAKSVALAYHLDPAFSGFAVVVADSAPEVADALKRRLGSLVRVSLGNLRRT